MKIPQAIDPRNLWCRARYTKFTRQKTKEGTICPEWKKVQCPCWLQNKDDSEFSNRPYRIEIDWRLKKSFMNCQFYKLK